MTISKLLVFGATGTQGHPVLEAALEEGLTVRAATRDLDEAEEKLPGRVEKVRADLLDAEDVQDAADGVDAIFFHLPVMPDEPEAEKRSKTCWLPLPGRAWRGSYSPPAAIAAKKCRPVNSSMPCAGFPAESCPPKFRLWS